MDDSSITVDHSLSEQRLQNDNLHDENLLRNQADLMSLRKEIGMTKKGPMHPTPLEYSWCSTYPRRAAILAYVPFTILATGTGILIVCFTSPMSKVKK